MGKERKKRKLHARAPKPKSEADRDKTEKETIGKFSLPVLGENIFAGVQIGADQLLTQKLPDFDAMSTVTSKTFKGMNMKKKDKRKMRHDAWMQKVDTLQMAKKEAKDKKRREKTAIVGDMKPLEDTLPTLELLLKSSHKETERAEKDIKISKKAIKKESVRKKEMLDGINLFQQVFKHPDFKNNPGAAITEHLKQKLIQEETMQS